MAEKKYIDSDHLLTALSVFNDYGNGNPHFLNGIRTAEEIIKDAPAADARPVKRGKWLAASRLVLQSNNHCDESTFWSMLMPPGYKPDNALLVVSALCDCCRCWHVAVRDAGSAIDDYHRGHISLPWFCPTCGADMRPKEDNDG